MHILIVEDDAPVAKFLSMGLERENYKVRIATNGGEVPKMLEEDICDLLLLDLKLPDMSGIDVLRQVRATNPLLPVIILTGSGSIEDRVEGLDSGADDYLTKPFAFSELTARLRALLRRTGNPFQPVLRCLDLELDRVGRTVRRKDRSIELTPKEFALLEYLMLNAGHEVSRSAIIRNVWKLSADTMTNVVDVYINYLRRKIGGNSSDRVIHTVRGAGYRVGSPNAVVH
jgi:DNA-binding response OmpR family regulator